jgi:hypothetical protein
VNVVVAITTVVLCLVTAWYSWLTKKLVDLQRQNYDIAVSALQLSEAASARTEVFAREQLTNEQQTLAVTKRQIYEMLIAAAEERAPVVQLAETQGKRYGWKLGGLLGTSIVPKETPQTHRVTIKITNLGRYAIRIDAAPSPNITSTTPDVFTIWRTYNGETLLANDSADVYVDIAHEELLNLIAEKRSRQTFKIRISPLQGGVVDSYQVDVSYRTGNKPPSHDSLESVNQSYFALDSWIGSSHPQLRVSIEKPIRSVTFSETSNLFDA